MERIIRPKTITTFTMLHTIKCNMVGCFISPSSFHKNLLATPLLQSVKIPLLPMCDLRDRIDQVIEIGVDDATSSFSEESIPYADVIR